MSLARQIVLRSIASPADWDSLRSRRRIGGGVISRRRFGMRLLAMGIFPLVLLGSAAIAQPVVVPTAEGQLGPSPDAGQIVKGAAIEPVGGALGDVLFARLFGLGGMSPPPAQLDFLTNNLNAPVNGPPISSLTATFEQVFKLPPVSTRSRNAADDGDFVAFSFAVDGSMPDTMMVRIATFDETGQALASTAIDNIPTFPPPVPGFPPDPSFAETDLAVDDQGRVTVVYTEFFMNVPRVRAQRLDAVTGQLLEGPLDINVGSSPDMALLDPAGNRLVIATSDFATIRGNVLDVSGSSPAVLPEFPISTTPALINSLPAVAADPATGVFTVVWENVEDLPGDPVNVRARRFDADGNPVGDDFIVNDTRTNAQGQPGVDFGPAGFSAVVWAGDSAMTGDLLDVFTQVYDADGNPIGGEMRVNSATTGEQTRPLVRWSPEIDRNGNPQFVVVWRDLVGDGDETPQGTGTGYKCFGMGEDPTPIFEDGFESGDTACWSSTRP